MKTSALYRFGKTIRRALLPSDGPPRFKSDRVAKFIAEHVEEGKTVVSMDPFRTKPFKRTVPDQVWAYPDRFYFERGKTMPVHVGAADAIARVDEIDREIERLGRERDEALEDAFVRGRPLRKSDLVADEEGSPE